MGNRWGHQPPDGTSSAVAQVPTMTSRAARVASWVVAGLLLLVSGWSFNLATYNWFAADFHDRYSRVYASRGNIFSVVAMVLLAASVWVIVALLRSRRKRRLEP